jgi:hypothetical protein
MRGHRANGGRGLTPSLLARDPWVLLIVGYGLVCSAVVLLDTGPVSFTVRFIGSTRCRWTPR